MQKFLAIVDVLPKLWPFVVLLVMVYMHVKKVPEDEQRALLKAMNLSHLFVGDGDKEKREFQSPATPSRWTDEEADRLAKQATERLRSALGPDLPKVMASAPAGWSEDRFLRSMIEAAVTALKSRSTAIVGAPPAATATPLAGDPPASPVEGATPAAGDPPA